MSLYSDCETFATPKRLYLSKSRILKGKTGGILRLSNKLAVDSIFFNALKRAIKFPDNFVGNA
jgi:hypothetical protein